MVDDSRGAICHGNSSGSGHQVGKILPLSRRIPGLGSAAFRVRTAIVGKVGDFHVVVTNGAHVAGLGGHTDSANGRGNVNRAARQHLAHHAR